MRTSSDYTFLNILSFLNFQFLLFFNQILRIINAFFRIFFQNLQNVLKRLHKFGLQFFLGRKSFFPVSINEIFEYFKFLKFQFLSFFRNYKCISWILIFFIKIRIHFWVFFIFDNFFWEENLEMIKYSRIFTQQVKYPIRLCFPLRKELLSYPGFLTHI